MESEFQSLNHIFPKVKITLNLIAGKDDLLAYKNLLLYKKSLQRKIVPRTFDVLLVSLEVEILKNL